MVEDHFRRLHEETPATHMQGRDDLSNNGLDMPAMIITAWAFTVCASVAPQYVDEGILMQGDNMSADH